MYNSNKILYWDLSYLSIIVDVEFRAPGRWFSLPGLLPTLDLYNPEHWMLLTESIYALVPERLSGVLESDKSNLQKAAGHAHEKYHVA